MKAFHVTHPGILTTYQDLGRTGFRKYGIPQSGAMDFLALRAANLLVGNQESAVGLEVTLQGLQMEALAPLPVAVTGADLQFTVNTEYYLPWRSVKLKVGDQIHFKSRKTGLRAYLAVRGGLKAPIFLGSGSVFRRGSMGEALRKGEILELSDVTHLDLSARSIPDQYIPKTADRSRVRVILGPQTEAFTQDGVATFLSSEYRIKPQSDRMAYRLEGPRITHRAQADIISEPVIPGSIQVPSDGLPIVLMADGQVTGGYVKIAHVISADMPLLSQVMPGEHISFEAVDLDQAYQLLEERERLLVWLRVASVGSGSPQ